MFMDKLKEIFELFQLQFQGIGYSIANYLPNILLAILIIIIGWVVAKILRDLIKKLIVKINLDSLLRKLELERFMQRAGYRLNSGRFFGEVVRWLVFIGFFVGVLDILNLDQIKYFVFSILENVGNIIVALIIFVIAVVVARFVKNISQASAKAMNVRANQFIGSLASFVVYLMATVTILGLFTIFRNMVMYIDLLVMGIVFAFSLGGGIAFGLGGKERAKELLEKMKR